jgi:hypothetical protein
VSNVPRSPLTIAVLSVTALLAAPAAAYAGPSEAVVPRHVPALLVRVLGREHFMYRSTEQRGSSNAKAKRNLGYDPCFRSWRQGFETELLHKAAA